MFPSSFPQHHPPSAPPQSSYENEYDHQPPPPYATGIPVINGNWSSSLCACCSDFPNCCLTCWCPCITFGQIAEILDKGNTSCGVHGALYVLITSLTSCGCMYSCMYRSKMRSEYGLVETPCNDCLVHCCCEPCALCQEYRHLKHLGFDISIGWEGNVQRHNRGLNMGAPLPPRGMYR